MNCVNTKKKYAAYMFYGTKLLLRGLRKMQTLLSLLWPIFPSTRFSISFVRSTRDWIKGEDGRRKEKNDEKSNEIHFLRFVWTHPSGSTNDIRRILAIYFYLTADDKTVEWTRHVYGKRIMSGSRTVECGGSIGTSAFRLQQYCEETYSHNILKDCRVMWLISLDRFKSAYI